MYMKYFGFSLVVAALAFVGLGGYVAATVGFAAALTVVWQATSLAVVEVAVSFDNAVVNATHLHRMNQFWRRAFLTVGILVAVIGMRFYLPLQLVAIIGDISLAESFNLAMNHGDQFATLIKESADSIHGFGGAFLMMVALAFFIDHEKDNHWIPAIEEPLMWLGQIGAEFKFHAIRAFEVTLTLSAAAVVYIITRSEDFMVAAVVGILVFYALELVKHYIEKLDERLQQSKAKWIAGGLGTFVYLEILDASFSLDGVIAAFALSDNLFVIAIGLGVGALFVRSMTIMLDETGTLKSYQYMENGAFYAIVALALSMFIGTFVHVPEWLVATVSIVAIGGAVVHSIIENRRQMIAALQ